MTATDNGAKPFIKAPTTIDLTARIDKLETELAETKEQVHKLKLLAAQQLLANPAIQEQMMAALINKM